MGLNAIEIFKPGRHTARSGAVVDMTAEDIIAAAEAYDPQLHEAPIVIGHPKHNAPAFGWLNKLFVDDAGNLNAEPIQVNKDFAEMVRNGSFKKVSASFYTPDAPGNPKPGVYYLRHVGFLGAQPPAIKGLKPAEFADDETGIVDFEEKYPSRWYFSTVATMFRRVRDHLIDTLGLEKADEVLPEWNVKDLEEQAAKIPNEMQHSFSEPNSNSQETVMSEAEKQKLADLEQENANLKKEQVEFAEREKKIADKEAALKKQEVVKFVEAQIKAGKILPRDKTGMIEFMGSLDAESVIEFAEGEGDNKTTIKKSGKEYLQGYINAMPDLVNFDEVTAQPEKEPVDMNKADEIANAALEFCEAEQKAGRPRPAIHAAVSHVVKKQKSVE